MTYSIVAYDPDSKQFGVAVQSHHFSVGSVVPWAEAGIGAVATQSLVEISYGPLGLELMRAGKTAQAALADLAAKDSKAEVRQVAMVDKHGSVAAHTGGKCIAEAGHKIGQHYSVQANLMRRSTVWGAMAQAFESARGDLAERMLAALEAAEAEGGDIRGRQSAAMLVVSSEPAASPWAGRLFDLRVDDHLEPLHELRRLLAIARAYGYQDRAAEILKDAPLDDRKLDLAAREMQKAALTIEMEDNPELIFWYAVSLAAAGQADDSLPHFQSAFALNAGWRELIPRLAKSGLFPDDAHLIEKVTQLG